MGLAIAWAGSGGCFLQREAQHSTLGAPIFEPASTHWTHSSGASIPLVALSAGTELVPLSCPTTALDDGLSLSPVTGDEMSYLLPRTLPGTPPMTLRKFTFGFGHQPAAAAAADIA